MALRFAVGPAAEASIRQACNCVRSQVTLRFAVGDRVACLTNSPTDDPEDDEWAVGTVSAVFHREPQFPPDHCVPYQVRLDAGGAVFVPEDDDELVRSLADDGHGERLAVAVSDRLAVS